MSVAKFTKVESLFRTTLAAGVTSTQTTIVLNTAPGNLTQFPQWLVIEPLSSNYEIIYVPADDGSATLTNVVRGINPNSDSDVADPAYQKAHAANVDVILAPMHRHWNEVVDVMDGNDGTGAAVFRIGLDTDVDITIYANNADANKPYFQYNATQNKWLISNDGVSTYDITSGGSGLTRGLGVNIVGSAITLDVRTNGGLRNNQGTGSQQSDVDPAIVARLDTANAWAAVQTISADNLQISSDANSANDAVRKALLDAYGFGDASDGDLSISSGTTTLNTAGKYVYRYGNVSITGTGVLGFGANLINRAIVIIVNGDLTVTSSATPAVDGRLIGGAAGSGGAGGASGGSAGSAGSGGATRVIATTPTGGGGCPDAQNGAGGGGGGAGLGNAGVDGGSGGGGGGAAGVGATAERYDASMTLTRLLSICHIGGGGAGGGGGDAAVGGTGGVGGRGGGCIIFLVKGSINITSTFDVSGENGGNGVNGTGGGGNIGGAGGGGGGGGFIGVFYLGSVIANTATFTVSGGTGGSAGTGGGSGVGGAGGAGRSQVGKIQSLFGLFSV